MWILSKQGKELFNLNEITNLYIVDAGEYRNVAVRASFSHKPKDLTLGEYPSYEMAREAIRLICLLISRRPEVIEMPTDESVEISMRDRDTKARSATGKKTVRRGGS